ncbi:MAG: potassium channel protein [Proteobacteria bacterium]|nr:potassium channel protein [Pseudomonadota bacterium]
MKTLIRIIFILIFLPLIGTFGFMLIEKWRFLDSLYMAFITLSTVGYEVVKPLSDSGKVFVILYLGIGLSIFVYSLTQIGEMAVSGELKRLLGGRFMNRQIAGLTKHYIICGIGRMGQSVAEELHKKQHPFVVIEKDPARAEHALQAGWLCITGDATDDEILQAAGLTKARCLATVLPNDADNLFTVMTARLLRKDLTIITRASNDKSITKLRRAGATRIVSPYSTGAVKIFQLMINPQLEEFIEIIGDQGLGIDLTILHVDRHSRLLGKTLKDLRLPDQEIMVIGMRREGQKLELPPPLDVRLKEHDSLIVVGKSAAIHSIFGILE